MDNPTKTRGRRSTWKDNLTSPRSRYYLVVYGDLCEAAGQESRAQTGEKKGEVGRRMRRVRRRVEKKTIIIGKCGEGTRTLRGGRVRGEY